MSTWLLPESLADILPAEARRIEEIRRNLLDLYRTYGYELVAPPLVEYIDSLLSGNNGRSLNLRTCKLVDQLSGRTLGVRADMTTQVARIDAHLLNREGVARLCYCGSVLHARPAGLLAERELLQIGAEIFGHSGVEADIEIIELALESVRRAGVTNASLDLNHPAVFRAIMHSDAVLTEHANTVSDFLSNKDIPELNKFANELQLQNNSSMQALFDLTTLYGDKSVLDKARNILPSIPELHKALDDLQTLIKALPDHNFSIDLADMGSGYGYHSGVVFSVYASNWHSALAKGGRFDGIGKAFGRSRPATGFSLDLRNLASGLAAAPKSHAIRAQWSDDPELTKLIKSLRASGEIVIQLSPQHKHGLDEFVFDRELIKNQDQWVVQSIN